MTSGKEPWPALAGRLEQMMQDIERVVQRMGHLLDKARQTGDDGYLDGVALNLHSFYAGMESCFEDIARTVDGGLPSGANWHQDLLQQMTADMKDFRPPVIHRETRDCLDEYRAFRHLVRNIYTFNLKPARLKTLGDKAYTCFAAVRQDMDAFIDFLRKLDAV
ncbi:MAG: hypothetical protein ACLFNW_02120 [Desulfobacterales bacterium]